MADFTAHRYPVLAVPCPTCGAVPGRMCRRPSEHTVWSGWHESRAMQADDLFVAQHGVRAGLVRQEDGRLIIVPDHIPANDPRVLKYTTMMEQPTLF